MKKRTHYWAVDLGDGCIGWFGESLEGPQCYWTRARAREEARKMKRWFPRARPVKIGVIK